MNDEDNLPTPNVPLLRKALEWVEQEDAKPSFEREWNQGDWFRIRDEAAVAQGWCGTTCCVAGWVGLNSDTVQPVLKDGRYTDQVEYATGMRVHVSDYAQHALGLTERQADTLFRGGNDAKDIRRIMEEIVGEAL